jgi:transposase
MAMGRSDGVQDELMATWAEMPRSPGHAFYDRLQDLLREAGFDAFVEEVCKPYYAPRMGAPSLPPGRYFRMHMIGYFEGIDSERGIAWRCADSFSLRDFLRLSNRDKAPDHSWLSRTRSRLPHEAHEKAFGFVLKLVAEHGLLKGERIGVDGSTMEANAALRTIVRRDNGETYRQMLTRMAQESGIETPTAEDLARFDRKRKGKTLSNADWESPTDPEAKIAKMKDGTTHLAYKPEHAVDLDTGVVVAAPIHPADEGDTTTLSPTLEAAARNLDAVGLAPSEEEPCVLVADKGYHGREHLKALEGGVWKTRIAEPEPARGYLRWHGDEAARRAVYANRARLKSTIGRETMRRRGELVERSFAHILDRGGMRRAWLRGRENIHKRYLIHVAGFNLGLLMRALYGKGTPKQAAEVRNAIVLVLRTDTALTFALIAVIDGEPCGARYRHRHKHELKTRLRQRAAKG